MKAKLLILFVISVVWGCEPKPDSAELLDQMVVSTDNYNGKANFSTYSTFAIPSDSIQLYSNDPSDPYYLTKSNSGEYVDKVISTLTTNMTGRSFTKVDRKQNPDLGIVISVVHNYNISQSVSYGGGYGAGYYGYGGYGGYGGYPSYVTTTEQNRGSLIVDLVDLKNKTPDNKVTVIWTATLSDLYNALDYEKESVDAIKQAFKQSPYITP